MNDLRARAEAIVPSLDDGDRVCLFLMQIVPLCDIGGSFTKLGLCLPTGRLTELGVAVVDVLNEAPVEAETRT